MEHMYVNMKLVIRAYITAFILQFVHFSCRDLIYIFIQGKYL